MTREIRKSKRYNRFLPIKITAFDSLTNTVISRSFPGRIINISRHGACLLLSQISTNSFHIFHSFKENDRMYLQLNINIQPEIINCKIPAHPVWMGIFDEGDIRAYKIGIAFECDAKSEEMIHLEQVISKR